MDILTPEERQVRLKKADSIRRMLADTGATTGSRNAGKISLNTNITVLTRFYSELGGFFIGKTTNFSQSYSGLESAGVQSVKILNYWRESLLQVIRHNIAG